MAFFNPDQSTLLDLPACSPDDAGVIILPLPLEQTVSYGKGTRRGPAAIIEASAQVETFDTELEIDFEESPRIHNAAPLTSDGAKVKGYLDRVARAVQQYEGRFVLGLGGEHTVSWGLIEGLDVPMEELTVVQIDAHPDLRDEYEGERWCHASVMRRLLDEGCRIIQIGVRSAAREEFRFAASEPRIETFYAHQLPERWDELIRTIGAIRGPVYLTLDVDGLDPSVILSTGTPSPGGLSWPETMGVLRALSRNREATWRGADLVEFVPSSEPPGYDIIAASLAVKILAFYAARQQVSGPAGACGD